jgi:hypothetical protein
LHCDTFTSSLAPFSTGNCEPEWFTREFPAKDVEHEEETNAILKAYLTPTFLSSRIFSTKSVEFCGLYCYQPNLVARQFGLVQPLPCSLYKTKEDLRKPKNENTWRILQQVKEQVPAFNHVAFDLSFACTESFFRWWRGYYIQQSANVDQPTLLSKLFSAFHPVQ